MDELAAGSTFIKCLYILREKQYHFWDSNQESAEYRWFARKGVDRFESRMTEDLLGIVTMKEHFESMGSSSNIPDLIGELLAPVLARFELALGQDEGGHAVDAILETSLPERSIPEQFQLHYFSRSRAGLNACLVVLQNKGYDISVQLADSDEGSAFGQGDKLYWNATKDRRDFHGTSPAETLGLVAMVEWFGDDWRLSMVPDVLAEMRDREEQE